MKTTISTKSHGEITFFVPILGGYVWVDLNGKSGTLGNQICRGGNLRGSTKSFHGDDRAAFDKLCRNWWKAYLKKHREMK